MSASNIELAVPVRSGCTRCRRAPTHLLRRLPGLFAALAVAASVQAGDNEELKQRSAELSAVEARMGAVVAEFERTQGRLDAGASDLREVESRLSAIVVGMRNLEADLAAARVRATNLRAEAAKAGQQLAMERAKLGLQLQAAYRLGSAAPLRVLLDAESTRDSQRMVTYLGYLHRARALRIARVLTLSRETDELEAVATEQEQRQEELLAEQRDALAELERERGRRAALVTELSAALTDQQQELDRLAQDRKRLETLVRSLHTALANRAAASTANFGKRRGQLAWPVDGRVTAQFGDSRGDAGVPWSGLLIAAPTGREIKAVHGGIVVFAEWLRGFGLTLIIDHGDDYLTIYSHNDALYRELGDRVVAGEVVAEVGRSGGGDRDALYFEIRYRGKALDPAPWLARR